MGSLTGGQMTRNRNNWVAIGLLLTSLVGVILGIATVAGLGSAPSGDVMLSSSATSTDLLVAFGALTLLGLDLVHGRRRTVRADSPRRR
jgi:hypothetical protein